MAGYQGWKEIQGRISGVRGFKERNREWEDLNGGYQGDRISSKDIRGERISREGEFKGGYQGWKEFQGRISEMRGPQGRISGVRGVSMKDIRGERISREKIRGERSIKEGCQGGARISRKDVRGERSIKEGCQGWEDFKEVYQGWEDFKGRIRRIFRKCCHWRQRPKTHQIFKCGIEILAPFAILLIKLGCVLKDWARTNGHFKPLLEGAIAVGRIQLSHPSTMYVVLPSHLYS
jgi:hypothetical protein